MIRIAHTGDLHLEEGPRFDSTKEVLDWIVEDGKKQNVDLWLVGGDISGTQVPHRMTTKEELALIEIFQGMAAGAPIVLIYGNHDAPSDLDVFNEIRARYPIYVLDRPEVVEIGTSTAVPANRPPPDVDTRVFCLPYPSKRHVMAELLEGGIEGQKQKIETSLRTILNAWKLPPRDDRIRILLGHLNIGGSEVAGGEVMIGQEIELSPHDLDELQMDYVALSHIHLHQKVASKAWYAGSPDRSNFGESDEKGYLIVDVQRGEMPAIQRRVTPARRYVTITSKVNDRLIELPTAEETRGAEIRLRIDVAEEDLAACESVIFTLSCLLKDNGAHSVKVDRRIIPKTRIRSEAIVHATTVAAKLEAYWDSLTEGAPEPQQRQRALQKLAELEGQVEF